VVINITICGDWAGAAYNSGGFPGTCADAVADPSNYDSTTPLSLFALVSAHSDFIDALIRVNSISVYQKC
jgi:hypothetical protein